MRTGIIAERWRRRRILGGGLAGAWFLGCIAGCVTDPVRTPSLAATTVPTSRPVPRRVPEQEPAPSPLRRAEAGPVPIPVATEADLLAQALATLPRLPDVELSATGAQPSPPADLWGRLRGRFALPQPESRRIDQELEWFVRHPDYLQRVFERARPWLAWIERQIEARGMPAEIALLPVVESGFNPYAYSHGRASGLWQFIPGTGRRFGLIQDWWYDGRRDVIASTRAALDYLQSLHEEFSGDWLLALAAYNSGEGTVHQAVRRNRRRGRPTDFWHLRLPRETRSYVPRLLALARLVRTPERYGLTLPRLDPRPVIAIVDTQGQIDLALAAELAGIDLETLQRLNPAFNRWATRPGGPHRLVVPREAAARFRTRLAALDPGERVQWIRHRVRRGETLITIARRHETTVALLRRVNHLRGDHIRAGSHLLIPRARRALSEYTLRLVARAQARLRRARNLRKVVYRVRSGDTLWEIARRHGTGVRQLARWNGMAPADPLRPGQQLVIWRGARGTNPRLGRTLQRIVYTVRRGDSLARIASRFRVRIADLKRWNRGRLRGRYLHPGQRLTLYVDVTRQSDST